MSKGELLRSLFSESAPSSMVKVSALNPLPDIIKANSLVVLGDPSNKACTQAEATLMEVAQKVQQILEPLSPEEADLMARYRDEIGAFLGETSISMGITSSMLGAHLQSLKGTLEAIEHLHQDTFKRHGHLRSPEFFAERARLMSQLDAHLQAPLVRRSLNFSDHHKLKRALGISNSSLVHHWTKAGAPGQIPGYATHLDRVAGATKYMKAGGHLGVGIGGVASAMHVQEVCSAAPGSPKCEQVRLVERSKFLGGWGGGTLGASGMTAAGGTVCMALGVSTGVGGVACVVALVGLGAAVGTSTGTKIGEATGEFIYGLRE